LSKTEVELDKGTSMDSAEILKEALLRLRANFFFLICYIGMAGAALEVIGAFALENRYSRYWKKGRDVVAFLILHGFFSFLLWLTPMLDSMKAQVYMNYHLQVAYDPANELATLKGRMKSR
jgi:hypothetical protein